MHYLRSISDLVELVKDKTDVVVCCYSDWCPASSQSKPVFERVAVEHARLAAFAKVRTDMSADIDQALQVAAIPTFYAFKLSKLVGVLRGSVSEVELVKWMYSALSVSLQPSA